MGFILSLLLGYIPMLLFAGFVYWLDRYEKEPLPLLGGVFTWGAIVAAGGAFLINTVLGIGVYIFSNSESFAVLSTGSVIAPIVEESLKGLAVLAVFLVFRNEFDSVLDGMIYAAITALGFAATENIYYIYKMGYLESGYEGILALSLVRILMVGWQHPFYTSFIGIGLAVARLNKHISVKIAAPLIGWSLAVLLHSAHNTLAQLLSGAGGLILSTFLDWTGWAFIFCVVLIAIWSEQRTISAQLSEEVPLGTLSAQQYKTACSAWAQSLARLGGLLSGKYRATSRFYQLAAELAYKKFQRSRMGEETCNSQIIDRLRQDLVKLSPNACT